MNDQLATLAGCNPFRCRIGNRTEITDKPSQSWIGDWWEGWGFACLAWCLASDAYKLTQSHSDSYTSDSATYTRSDSFSLIQICSDSFISLTQIHPISLRFALTHSDSCNLTQICSASCSSRRFVQINKISRSLNIQIHLISFEHVPIHSDKLESTQIHTASLQILSASLRFIQIHKDLCRFAQISSN